MVVGFTSSEGRHLSDSVVDSHEVGVLRELGNDFTCMHPLSLMCYRGDRHEALFGGSVHLAFDLIKYLCEVPYWEAFTETSTSFVPLPIALTSGILVVVGFIRGCMGDNSSAKISSKYRSGRVPKGPGISPAAMKTWRSGVPRPESVVATFVGVCSSVGARGVPSWKGSESR
jgi:hypothetical protein